jgi:hypothetical protein
MRRAPVVAGLGAIAFSVLTLVAFVVANPPGGTYKASEAADYVVKGHRPAVFVSALLAMLAVLGLICLLAQLRDAIRVAPDHQLAGLVFWGAGMAAAACFAVGWGVVLAAAAAHAYGGSGLAIAPAVTYLAAEIGVVIIFGPAAMLLGFALIILVLNSRPALPAWLRWLTLLAGVAGIASPVYFPFFLVEIWGIVIGVWLLVGGRRLASPTVGTQASA